MNSYLVYGDQDGLEERLAAHGLEVGYRAEYAPVLEVRTEYALEHVRELLPEYVVSENKEYNIDDNTKP